jgi:hypothetical protein
MKVAQAFVQPSTISVAVCLGTAVSILLAFMCVSPSAVDAVVRWYTSYSFRITDDPALCTSRAIQLQSSSSTQPLLVILGASTTRESMSTAHIESLLATRTGQRVAVHNLTFSSQHILESLALTDAIPQGRGGVVVIGVNPIRVGKQVNVARYFRGVNLGFVSPSLREEAPYWNATPPQLSGWYAWDNRYFLLRLWKSVSNTLPRAVLMPGRRRTPNEYFYEGMPLLDNKHLQREYVQVRESLSAYDQVLPQNLAALERLVKRLEARRLQVVLVESPRNDEFAASFQSGDFYARYQRDMREFAQRLHLEYADPNTEVHLTTSEFYDWGHLRSAEARNEYSAALVRRLQHHFSAKQQ